MRSAGASSLGKYLSNHAAFHGILNNVHAMKLKTHKSIAIKVCRVMVNN